MTQRAYYHSDDLALQTQVLDCSPGDDGKFRVVLAATLFHPQGGGQLSDQGTIAGVAVSRVIQDGDVVVHITEHEVGLGAARIEIAPDVRSLHARLHSAGHLIANVVEPLGWLAVKGHHWPGEGRVVFEPGASPQALSAEALEEAINLLVASDAARHVNDRGGARSVGFGALPAYDCGGTHVASTAQVGRINILKLKEKKGQVSIQYDLQTP